MRRVCSLCGRVINEERLKILPDTHRCADCARMKGTDLVRSTVQVGMDPETYRDLLGAVRS